MRESTVLPLRGILTALSDAGEETCQQLQPSKTLEQSLKNLCNFSNFLSRTFVLLDGEHGQSVDDLIGGQRSTQGTAKDILERDADDAMNRRQSSNKTFNRINLACFCAITMKASFSN